MKTVITLFGIIVLLSVIAFPAMAQPAPAHSSQIEVISPQANLVSNLLHRNLAAGDKHYYRVNNLTGPFYYIFWRDVDDSRNINTPAADIKVSVLNLSRNMAIITAVDVDRSLSEERLINAIEITRNVHFDSGNDILLIIEGVTSTVSGNYAILVY